MCVGVDEWFNWHLLRVKKYSMTPCIVWSNGLDNICWKLVPVNKVFTNTFFQHDILCGCTTWSSIILLTVASKPLQHLITVSVGEQETTINIQLLREGTELNNTTKWQYDAGAASVASVTEKTICFYSQILFLMLNFTICLVRCWLTLATHCWNRNWVYSSIILTLAILHWHEHHIVNQT